MDKEEGCVLNKHSFFSFLYLTGKKDLQFHQARNQVLRFWGANYVLGGQDFCLYYMFETNFCGHNKFWPGTKNQGHCPKTPLWLRAWVPHLKGVVFRQPTGATLGKNRGIRPPSQADPGGVDWGDNSGLKLTKVTLFTINLHNSENICDIRPFLRQLFCHSSVVTSTSSLVRQ